MLLCQWKHYGESIGETCSKQREVIHICQSSFPQNVTTFSHPLDTTLPTTADVVSVVNVQLMLFWPGDPKFWFTKVKAQFSYRGPHRIPNMMISLIRICSRSARPLVLLQFDNPYSLQNAQITKPTTLSTF